MNNNNYNNEYNDKKNFKNQKKQNVNNINFFSKTSSNTIYEIFWFFIKKNIWWWILYIVLMFLTIILKLLFHSKILHNMVNSFKNINIDLKPGLTSPEQYLDVFIDLLKHPNIKKLAYIRISYSICNKITHYVFNYKISSTLRLEALKKILSVLYDTDYWFFIKNEIGQILERIDELPDSIVEVIQSFSENILTMLITISYSIYCIGKVKLWIFMLCLLIWMCLHFYIVFSFRKRLKFWSLLWSLATSDVIAKISDSLQNIFIIKAFAKEKQEINLLTHKFLLKEKNMSKGYQKSILIVNTLLSINFYICFFCILLPVLWLEILYKKKDKTLSFNILQEGGEIFALIWEVYDAIWNGIYEILQTFDDMYKILETISFLTQGKNLPKIYKQNIKKYKVFLQESTDNMSFYDKLFDNASIEFKNVSLKQNDKYLLQNLNFKIKTNEKIGIVGESGSGKSSLINLILGLFSNMTGKILINGVDISEIHINIIKKNITVIPQITYLFDRTIKDNIYFGINEEYDSKIPVEFLKNKINDTCSNFIFEKSQKLNFKIGKSGEKISGGQRQRLSILRGLLKKNAKIVILDEVTSAVDSITEIVLNSTIMNFCENKTSLIIAHKLNTIINMDRIMVLKSGKIIEFDTFDNLLYKKGYFYKLWNSQFLHKKNNN